MGRQLLDRADIVAFFGQVGGEGKPQVMAAGGFVDAGGADGAADFLLQAGFAGMAAAVLVCNLWF